MRQAVETRIRKHTKVSERGVRYAKSAIGGIITGVLFFAASWFVIVLVMEVLKYVER